MYKILNIFLSLLLASNIQAEDLCDLAIDAFQKAETIRELPIKHPVKCKVQSKQQVEQYLRETIDTKVPDIKLANEEKLFKKIGVIPRDYNYKEEIVKLYTSQLAGYYEPVSEYYVMAGWMPEMMQMPIAVHELTHALQDQYYNLDKFLDPENSTSDESLARSAVVEGDATVVMYDYFNQQSGLPRLAEQADVRSLVFQAVASSNMIGGFKEAPRSMQAFLLFPYTSGLNFSHYFLRREGYSGLNKIFNRIPKTTQEILHPEHYQADHKFLPLGVNDLKKYFELENLQVTYQDRLGEFILSTLINLEDERLATAWVNDLAVIEKDSDRVYWLLKLQNPEKAKQLANIFNKINPAGIVKSIQREEFLGLVLK